MVQFFALLWNKMNSILDFQMAEMAYQQACGSLFFHRYVICAITDPCGYGILPDHPDSALHVKLSAIAQVLGKLSHGVYFDEGERYMTTFNKIIEACVVPMSNLYAALAVCHSFTHTCSNHT